MEYINDNFGKRNNIYILYIIFRYYISYIDNIT